MGNTINKSTRAVSTPKATPAKLPPKVQITRTPIGPAQDKWEGVGTHSNTAAYDPMRGFTAEDPASIKIGEKQIADIHAQMTRVRVDPNILNLQDPKFAVEHPVAYAEAVKQLSDLKHLVNLAVQNGGRADLCLWDMPKGFQTSPAEMKDLTNRYAKLVKDLMAEHPDAKPGTFLVSAQNEPNRTKLSPQQVVQLNLDINDSLNKELGAKRQDVKLIAGDMTEGDASAKWIKAVVPKLGGVVDAFTFHVYMHPGESVSSLEGRLSNLRKEVNAAMPKGKPAPELLLTEYGVRGNNPEKLDQPGTIAVNGKQVPLIDTNEGAFRESQLVMAAAKTGFSGALRWGANPGGGTAWTAWAMTGDKKDGYAKKPAYYATQLFTTAVGEGWHAMQPAGTVAGEDIVTFRNPSGPGAAAVAANSNSVQQKLRLGGFAPNADVQVLVWNKNGSGKLHAETVKTNANGVVWVNVPPRGVAAATTQLTPPVE